MSIPNELKKYLDENIKIVHVVGGLAAHCDEIMPKDMQEKIENIWYEIEDVVGTKFNHDFWKKCQPRRSTYLACQATILARVSIKFVVFIAQFISYCICFSKKTKIFCYLQLFTFNSQRNQEYFVKVLPNRQ